MLSKLKKAIILFLTDSDYRAIYLCPMFNNKYSEKFDQQVNTILDTYEFYANTAYHYKVRKGNQIAELWTANFPYAYIQDIDIRQIGRACPHTMLEGMPKRSTMYRLRVLERDLPQKSDVQSYMGEKDEVRNGQ